MSNDWNWTVDLGSAQGVGQRSPAPRPKEYPHDAGFLSDSVEAFRTARSGEYCIWIVSPPGYSHSRCFEEVALSFQAAFLELGYRVPVHAQASIAPFAKLQVMSVDQAAFNEWGANSLNLNVAQQTTNSLRSTRSTPRPLNPAVRRCDEDACFG